MLASIRFQTRIKIKNKGKEKRKKNWDKYRRRYFCEDLVERRNASSRPLYREADEGKRREVWPFLGMKRRIGRSFGRFSHGFRGFRSPRRIFLLFLAECLRALSFSVASYNRGLDNASDFYPFNSSCSLFSADSSRVYRVSKDARGMDQRGSIIDLWLSILLRKKFEVNVWVAARKGKPNLLWAPFVDVVPWISCHSVISRSNQRSSP